MKLEVGDKVNIIDDGIKADRGEVVYTDYLGVGSTWPIIEVRTLEKNNNFYLSGRNIRKIPDIVLAVEESIENEI